MDNMQTLKTIKQEIINNKLSENSPDFKIIAPNNTILYAHISYQKHHYNIFSGQELPSRYILTLQRQKYQIAAFTDLNDESGATTIQLREVSRKSNKQLRTAIDKVQTVLPTVFNKFPQL